MPTKLGGQPGQSQVSGSMVQSEGKEGKREEKGALPYSARHEPANI